MKIVFLVLGLFLFISTNVQAEYILEPANCTLKKKINCGAYLYNNKTGATYFCNIEECKEIMQQIEESTSSEGEVKDSKKSNCGAYLYNNKTGTTFFCDLEKCKEIMSALEENTAEEVKGSKSKKSKIPKFKKKKKSKIPKFKKTE